MTTAWGARKVSTLHVERCVLDRKEIPRGFPALLLYVRKHPDFRAYACPEHSLPELDVPFERFLRLAVREYVRENTASVWMDWVDGKPRFSWIEPAANSEVNRKVLDLIEFATRQYDRARSAVRPG